MPAIQFKKDTITIQLSRGPVQVPATCWEFAAVHKGYGAPRYSWCVTHIPTGLRLVRGIRTRTLARRIAIALVRHVPEFADVTSDARASSLPERACNRARKLRGLASWL